MRSLPALLALAALAALLPPPAAAQAGPALEDPAGDVRSELSGVPGPPSAALYPGADLRSLAVEESDEQFTFRLAAAALPDAKDPGADGVLYEVLFAHNGREFQLQSWVALPALAPVSPQPPGASLSYRDSPEEAWSLLWFMRSAVALDPGAKTVAVQVPRLDLADAQGAPPFPGRVLDGLRAQARGLLSDATLVNLGGGITNPPPPQRFLDDMPDDPARSGAVAVRLGPAQTGHARLTSETPFRSSNGEATTFVYEADVHNLGQARDTFELSAAGLPHGYTLVLPVPVVAVEGGSSVRVPVLLTMPFGHQHGSAAAFLLEARSVSDPGSVGRLQMGVRFLAVPQPAGHHDTVYLHKAPNVGGIGPLFGYRHGYVNTLEEDPADTGENLHSSWLSVAEAGRFTTRWVYDLQPGLLMGLDVDPGKAGRLKVPVGTTAPLAQASMAAVLLAAPGVTYPAEDEGTVLARMAPTAPVDVLPSGQVLFEGDLAPDADAGRVPHERGLNLWLLVDLTYTGSAWSAGPEGTYIAPGGSARLPLREWHDPVDEVLASAGGPSLSALGPQERLVNPGEAAAFPVSVANPLDVPATIRLEVSGANAEWASLPASVTVPAHGTAQAAVLVRVPASANDLERADLVLQAWSKDHPEARGLLRLVAEADTGADHPDGAAVAGDLEKKGAPGPGLPSVAALLALALAGRRRRAAPPSGLG